MSATTSTVEPVKEMTLDELLAALDELLAMPDPIGVLYGQTVYLHHDTRELSFGDTRVDVDHVYLVGTAVRDEALRRLGEKRD